MTTTRRIHGGDPTRPVLTASKAPMLICFDEGRPGTVDFVAPCQLFRGHVTDLRVWRVARTVPEIASTFRRQLGGDGDGLALQMRLGDDVTGELGKPSCRAARRRRSSRASCSRAWTASSRRGTV